MVTVEQRELVKQFIGSYFHQDWGIDHDTVDDVISVYKKSHPQVEREKLAEALRSYAREMRNGRIKKPALFLEFRCEYDPIVEGLSEENWLDSIASRLSESAEMGSAD